MASYGSPMVPMDSCGSLALADALLHHLCELWVPVSRRFSLHRRAQHRGGTAEAWAQLSQQRRRRRGQGQRRISRGAGSSVRVCGHGSRRQSVAGAPAALAKAAAARGRPLALRVRHDRFCNRMLVGGTRTTAAGFGILAQVYACYLLHLSLQFYESSGASTPQVCRADTEGRARSPQACPIRSDSAAARAPRATIGPRASWTWTAAACRAASLTTSGRRIPPGKSQQCM